MKNQKIQRDNYMQFLKNTNLYLVNDNKKLKQNLNMFISENKQCSIIIKDLKKEIEILNNEIGNLMNEKKELLNKIKNFDKINNNYEINCVNDKDEKNKKYIIYLNSQINKLELQIEMLLKKVNDLAENKSKKIYSIENNNKMVNKNEIKENVEGINNLYNSKSKTDENINYYTINEDLHNQISDLSNSVKIIKENINRIDSNSLLQKTYNLESKN